jgi:hypothetical protein
MTDKKEDMGAVTHQLSAVDDDMHKSTNTKEANVASVALSMSMSNRYLTQREHTNNQ